MCCLLLCVDLCLWSFKPNNSLCGDQADTEGSWCKCHVQSKSKLLSAFMWFFCSPVCARLNSLSGHHAENAQIFSSFFLAFITFFLRISFLGYLLSGLVFTECYCLSTYSRMQHWTLKWATHLKHHEKSAAYSCHWSIQLLPCLCGTVVTKHCFVTLPSWQTFNMLVLKRL